MKVINIETPDGVAYQVTLLGDDLTLSDAKGQSFKLPSQLIPEFTGVFQDCEKIYWSSL